MLFGITLSAQSNLQFTSPCTDTLINTCATINDEVTLSASAMTDCSPDPTLTFGYQIDENNDGSVDIWGFGDSYTDVFSIGEHRVTFTVADECNNTISCEYLFSLGDFEPPTPVGFNGLTTVIIPSSGLLTLYASDFDSGNSTDNCTDAQDLIFSFSSDTNDTTLNNICDVLFSNNCGIISLEIWVTDEAGNQDFYLIYILVQDPNWVCGCNFFPPLLPSILVQTPEGLDLCNYEVCSNGVNCYNVNSSGIVSVPPGTQNGDIITLHKNDNPTNGMTTFDLLLIAKHIIGTQPFTSPFQLIAADANLSNTVTTFDIVLMSSIMLQINTQFPSGESWVFSPEEHVFDENISQYEFTAIKLGDMNGSANAGSCLVGEPTSSETRNLDDPLVLFTQNQFFEKGKTYTIPVYAENYQDLLGGQFTLNFEKEKIAIDAVIARELESLNENNFNILQNEGTLLCSWTKGLVENLDVNKPLFELKITAKENTSLREILEINSSTLRAEAYKEMEDGYGFLDIQLDILEKPSEEVEVIPNPFTDFSNIYFTNQVIGQVEFQIFDLSGKIIFSQTKNMDKGQQQFRIEKTQLPSSGIYFYEIKTNLQTMTGKLIMQ